MKLPDALVLAGLVILVGGIAMLSVPAAAIALGLFLIVGGVLLGRRE